jgi:hypothetical protein
VEGAGLLLADLGGAVALGEGGGIGEADAVIAGWEGHGCLLEVGSVL